MEIVYYVACSLDGKIATPDGNVEWLEAFEGEMADFGFADFYASVDALLLGSRTYEVALALGEWQAPDKPSWVFTGRELPVAHPSVTLTSDDPEQVVHALRSRGHERAWLMGGGELAASFVERGLITHYRIFVIPVLLGDGIPLFAPGAYREALTLTDVSPHPGGVVELIYERKVERRGSE